MNTLENGNEKFIMGLLLEEHKIKLRMTPAELLKYETLKDLRDIAHQQAILWTSTKDSHQKDIDLLIREVTKGSVVCLLIDEPVYHALHPDLQEKLQRLRGEDSRPPIFWNNDHQEEGNTTPCPPPSSPSTTLSSSPSPPSSSSE